MGKRLWRLNGVGVMQEASGTANGVPSLPPRLWVCGRFGMNDGDSRPLRLTSGLPVILPPLNETMFADLLQSLL